MDRKEKLKAYKKTEDYKEYNKEYQRKYRLIKKQNKVEVEKNENEAYERRFMKPLSDNTKKQYIDIIMRITNKNSTKIYRDLEEKLDYVFSGKELNKYHYNYYIQINIDGDICRFSLLEKSGFKKINHYYNILISKRQVKNAKKTVFFKLFY